MKRSERVIKFWDSLSNLLSGLGGAKDKAAATTWFYCALNQQQLEAAYRGDWMARKIIDIPADDATREWRNWYADDKQIALLEAEEEKIGLQHKVADALIKARLFGGAAMILGVGDQDPTKPLGNVKQGDLQFVHVLHRYELAPGDVDRDPLSRFYGEPKYYTISSNSKGSVNVHPSRVVRFLGNAIPTQSLATDGWGDSVLNSVANAIKDAGSTLSNIANLVFESKIDVVNVPNLADTLGSEEYTDQLITRFTTANSLKSLINTLVLNEDEKWQRIQTTFTGLPQVAELMLLAVCGAADIPATRFLGQSPAGLSATGESDIRNYYDKIASEQTTHITPALKRLDDVLQASALGKLDPNVYYEWMPLWQMDAKDKAASNLELAQAYQIDVGAGLIDPNTLRQAREAQIIENEIYPGFKQILADQPKQPVLNEANANVTTQFNQTKQAQQQRKQLRRRMADMQARTLYVRRQVLNASDILKWARAQGFRSTLPADKMHVTVAYSKDPVDWLAVGQDWGGQSGDGTVNVAPGGPRAVEVWNAVSKGPDAKVAVLQFASSDLSYRHECIRAAGASWDFKEYIPHITITYEPGTIDPNKVEPYNGAIKLGPEIFEEINPTWAAEIQEESTNDAVARLGKQVDALSKTIQSVKDTAKAITPPKPETPVTVKVDAPVTVVTKQARKQRISKQVDGSSIVEVLDDDEPTPTKRKTK